MDGPPRFTHGSGVLLFDAAGNTYLDLLCEWGVAPLGWNPPEVVQAVARSLAENSFAARHWAGDLGDRLAAELRAGLGHEGYAVFPALSGSEAVDMALRIARRATGRPGALYLGGAYHGSTLAARAACGVRGWVTEEERGGFPNVEIPVGPGGEIDLDRVEREIRAGPGLGCLILEPLRANAGFVALDPARMRGLRALCREHGLLFIADEITEAPARCGVWCGMHHFGEQADVLLLGKSLSAGVFPIAAVAVAPEFARFAEAPGFFSTFAWTPPACAGALATLEVISSRDLVERARRLRAQVEDQLEEIRRFPGVTAVAGMGMGFGIGVREDGRSPPVRVELARRLRLRGVIVGPNPNLPGLVLMPPLTIELAELRRGLQAILEVIASAPDGGVVA
ncbi:MAG TPA: aminotransferase class III-fold pyridoxal phosphate-dependent enzyme [Longimicrobium sp.]